MGILVITADHRYAFQLRDNVPAGGLRKEGANRWILNFVNLDWPLGRLHR